MTRDLIMMLRCFGAPLLIAMVMAVSAPSLLRSQTGGGGEGTPYRGFAMVDVDTPPGYDSVALQRSVRYPELAHRKGIEGSVILVAMIDTAGKVVELRVDRSDDPILTPAAEKAVRSARFTPARVQGHAVASWVAIPISFRLPKPPAKR
jgi:TonB family protein